MTITKSFYELPFVESLENVGRGPICCRDTVDSWEIDNGLIKVEAMPLGGSVLSIEKKGEEYLWQNREGVTYSGAWTHVYPLNRGLLQPGGLRVAAVTAEHGLYYDSDWDIEFNAGERESSITLRIKDCQGSRRSLGDSLSYGLYAVPGSTIAMGRYPVTDAEFSLTITLRPGEPFVRLRVSLVNTRETPVLSEIWLPQTYPINSESRIISHQRKRRCKDPWVYEAMLDGKFAALDMALDEDSKMEPYRGKPGFIFDWPPAPGTQAPPHTPHADLDRPLEWPSSSGGILYDYPRRDGAFHAVSFGDGRGAAYVSISDDERPHYTKMWSWGNRELFDRQHALRQQPPLVAARPTTEYYEPWGSAFTPAFFEPTQFPPGESSWDALIVPIDSGLGPDKTQAELTQTVDEIVQPLVAELE